MAGVDAKLEYLVRTFSRTKRKDFENYVVNAAWNQLADDTLQPVSQQYVRRNNGYALIDLYFPAVNVGIECDEGYHLGAEQKRRDLSREAEIAAELTAIDGDPSKGYKAMHVRASGSYEQMEGDIDRAVKEIKRRKNKFKPAPWEPLKPPYVRALEAGMLKSNDYLQFRTIADAVRCFGRDNKRYQRGYFSIGYGYHLWFPKMAIEKSDGTLQSAAFNIVNTISYDGSEIRSWKTEEDFVPDAEDKRGTDNKLITFVRDKDVFGKQAYRFTGVFQHAGVAPDDPKVELKVRIADSIDLTPWMK